MRWVWDHPDPEPDEEDKGWSKTLRGMLAQDTTKFWLALCAMEKEYEALLDEWKADVERREKGAEGGERGGDPSSEKILETIRRLLRGAAT